MNDETRELDIDRVRELAKLRAVLSVPGMQDVEVRSDIPCQTHGGANLSLDVYLPSGSSRASPAVIFVAGYGDQGLSHLVGLRLKEWGCYVSWGQLVAASGLVGITYSCSDPLADATEVLSFVRQNAADLGVDPARIGIWATSGNGPTALSLLTNGPSGLRFAVLSNAYLLDLDGVDPVDDVGMGNPKGFRDRFPEISLDMDLDQEHNSHEIKIARIRRNIAEGYYNSPEFIEKLADTLIKKLRLTGDGD